MMTPNKKLLAQKDALIHRLAWNEAFGCYNKSGFEHMIWPGIAATARWLIYFDLDHLHELNEQYDEYAPVDAMIKQALSILTRPSDYICGQQNSGDEFVVAITENAERAAPTRENAEGLQARLVEALRQQGLSATFAIVEVTSWDLQENLKPAVAQVKALKRARGISR